MNQPNIADLELLTPGSVWNRSDGRSARFLFFVNDKLPRKLQSEFPMLAVYADENDNIFAVPVDRFLSNRQFYNVDPELETRLSNLLAFSGEAGDDDFTLEGDQELLVSDTGDGSGDAEVINLDDSDAGTAQDEMGAPPTYEFHASRDGDVALSASTLAECVTSYQQFPQTDSNTVLHTLLVEGLPKDKLIASFSTEVDAPIYSRFVVNTPDGAITVDWDAFVGVFPCVYAGETMYQVIFQTNTVFVAPDDEDEQSELAAEPQVEHVEAEVADTAAEPAAVVEAATTTSATAG